MTFRKWPSEIDALKNTQGNYTLRKSYIFPCTHKGELYTLTHTRELYNQQETDPHSYPHHIMIFTVPTSILSIEGMSMVPVSVCVGMILIGDIFLMWACVWHGYDLLRVLLKFSCVSRNSEGTIFCGSLSERHFLHCQHFFGSSFGMPHLNLHWLILSLITHHIWCV